MKQSDFLHFGANSWKLKVDWKILGNGRGQNSGAVTLEFSRTLKSAVSQEWNDGLSLFFACWYKFRKTQSHFHNL